MTTAADHADDTLSPTNQQQFVHLANNLFELLQTAKRELERDHAAAKASLATASSILQSEIERRSHTQGARPGALAAWQIARVRAFIDENLHRTIRVKDIGAVAQRSAASPFLAVLQASHRRITARLRGEEKAGEGMSTDDHQFGIAARNSPERRLFRSSTSVQALQAGVWSKSSQLEARP